MTPRTDFPTDVDVVIVTHNNLTTLTRTLESLQAAGCPAPSITVVDIASTDGTSVALASQWPAIARIGFSRNDGPCPARNAGILAAARPYVLLMDADVLVAPDAVQRLRTAMRDDSQAKIGSPIVVHLDRPDVIQYAGCALHFMCEAVNPWRDRSLTERGPDECDIGVAPACALLLDRAAAIEVGLFDERYFMGKDDGDFTHRVKMAGYSILEVPSALALHHSRQRGTWMFRYQIRNRWHFMLKNYEWRTLFFLLPILLIHEPAQLVLLVAKGHLRSYAWAVGRLLAMIPALPADRAAIRRFRRRHDRELLVSGALLVRDDLAGSVLARRGKRLYERAIAAYWSLLTRTVLADGFTIAPNRHPRSGA
jgi:GT2 family glycosyltransferase